MPEPASTRLDLVGPSGTDPIADGDDTITDIIAQLELVAAGFLDPTEEAFRPAAAAAHAHKLHYSTDTGLVSYCTGSSWIDLHSYDADLAAIAALSTTSYGRSLLTTATPAWTALSLLNSWTGASASYTKDAAGVVHLRDSVQNVGNNASTLATLPVGFRPVDDGRYFTVPSPTFNTVATVFVDTDGDIVVTALAGGSSGSNALIRLDGVTFPTW